MSFEADEILRFRVSERHLHWAIAAPFKVCYVTALILVFVYNPDPHRPLRDLVSWIHRLSGLCLAVLPPLAIVLHWRDWHHHWHNVRTAWTWSRDDFKWLALMVPAALSSRVSLPHQGKFNAAEKINFMVLTATYPGYVMTGLTIWFLGIPYVSWLLHFGLAAAATPLLFGHVFMATINPDTRIGLSGMLTGMVDREWARHHYTKWYEDHHASAKSEPVRPPVVFLPRGAALPAPLPGVSNAAAVAVEPAVQPMNPGHEAEPRRHADERERLSALPAQSQPAVPHRPTPSFAS